MTSTRRKEGSSRLSDDFNRRRFFTKSCKLSGRFNEYHKPDADFQNSPGTYIPFQPCCGDQTGKKGPERSGPSSFSREVLV
jgi:hypothetical protein